MRFKRCRGKVGDLSTLRIALIVTTIQGVPPDRAAGLPPDAFTELDTEENVGAYTGALEATGHEVVVEEASPDLLIRLNKLRPDICFNLAEGYRGEGREAQVPALLEMMGLRYTGPNPLGAAISLDKPIAKRILSSWGLPTPPFQVFETHTDPLQEDLQFPLFAKPAHEGAGMGIGNRSVCSNEEELRDSVAYLIETYHEPALVESYVEGREISCGLVGNGNASHVFPINEVDFSGYPKGLLPIYGSLQKFDYANLYKHTCPALLGADLGNEVQWLTRQTFRATLCRDFARVDFRIDRRTNRPTILEVNSLPGITPNSDLTLMAQAEGWTHGDLVRSVLNAALRRYGLHSD